MNAQLSDSKRVEHNAPSLRLLLGALMLVMLLSALDQTIVSTALPTIVSELGGIDKLSWIVTAYTLSSTIVVPLYGKFGDLLGRKKVLIFSIIVFLGGSALCGLAQNMTQLIFTRAFQGLGGGGLIVISMAAVADVISPAERGRYQGLFGAVFGFATVLGPLLGGLIVQHISWRWIFYINIPIGLIALLVITNAFNSETRKEKHRIDYQGALFLSLALLGITLFTSEGGTSRAWTDPVLWLFMTGGLVSIFAFILTERKAAEPIIPLTLFKSRSFVVSSFVGFIIGMALFGSVTFLPLYLQVVKYSSPMQAGLQLIPLMMGMLSASIISGRIISRTGRYKIFPVIGTLCASLGLFMLSAMPSSSPIWLLYVYSGLLGLGIGMVMQILILIVQNAVDARSIGVATSAVTMFRSVGGSIGVALFGTVFSMVLRSGLSGISSDPRILSGSMSPAEIHQLPVDVSEHYLTVFGHAVHTSFFMAASLMTVAFAASFLMKEEKLKGR